MINIMKWAMAKGGGNPHERQQMKEYEMHKNEAGLASKAAAQVPSKEAHQKAARMQKEASRKAVSLKDKQSHAEKAKEHESSAAGFDEGKHSRDQQGKFS